MSRQANAGRVNEGVRSARRGVGVPVDDVCG